MKISVNIRHLEEHELRLEDSVPAEAIELESQDELIQFEGAVSYDLTIQRMEQSILAQGIVSVRLRCECSRCLKPFRTSLSLPDWVAHLPLSGEEAVSVSNDCVDLTPFIREDIFLALPQHPLCSKDCQGLWRELGHAGKRSDDPGRGEAGTSNWAGLDNLNL